MDLTARYCFTKKHNRQNKYDSPVSEMELLKMNTHYALIQHPDERQSNISLRDLAPTGGLSNPQEGSAVLEPINFPMDSPEDRRDSDTNTRSAPQK